jgi:hypothetical protein
MGLKAGEWRGGNTDFVDSAQTSGALVAMAIFAKGRITGKITSDLLFLAFFSTFFFFFFGYSLFPPQFEPSTVIVPFSGSTLLDRATINAFVSLISSTKYYFNKD